MDLQEPLTKLLWSKGNWACLSATLTVDSRFEHFCGQIGAIPEYQESIASPFDFTTQAALYTPPEGAMLDPTIARREKREDEYHDLLAAEIERLIRAMSGRTLVLFHSRREMEETYRRMRLGSEYPILIQPRYAAAATGDQFRTVISASLFGLRSFWTGFDAPGETLSCVALVRIPFEVPVDPPQVVRIASLQMQGRDPFAEHALPKAKLMIRQGVGRLIRRQDDRGVIALLDARLRTKRYGEEMIDNLPPGMRHFRDIADAAGWIGLGEPIAV